MALSPIFRTPTVQPGILGLDRRQQQVQGVSDLLTSLGIGLMGNGPSATPQSPLQGLGQGLAMNGQLAQQRQAQQSNTIRDQIAQGQYGMEQQKFSADQEYQRARKDQLEKLIQGLPADQQTAARADPDTFFKAYSEHLFAKPTDKTPKLQTMRRGTTDETGYFDDSGKWVKMSEGAAFAPQRDNPNYGNTPIYVTDPQGNTHLFRFDPNGGAIEAQLPKGWQVAPQAQIFDTGTAGVPINKRTGAQIPGAPEIPKDVAGTAAQTQTGTATGKAQVNLPAVQQNADLIIKTIEDLKNAPGREAATGMSSILNPLAIPGSDRKDFLVKQEQLKGQAFLNAYDGLRSSGAITDIEGEKATAAKARLDTAQSDGEYLKALDDFETAIKDLTVIAQRKAQGNFQPLPSNSVPPPPPGFRVVP